MTGTAGRPATVHRPPRRCARCGSAYRRELLASRRPRPGRRAGSVERHRALADLADHDAAGRPGGRRGRAAGERAAPCRLAVIAMGKTGGRELNYVSDVDVVFVAEPAAPTAMQDDAPRALATATPLAAEMMRICGEVAWEVDAGAAPGGQGRRAGAHAGQPRGLLPAVGPHLGVPGAAQGAAGRRRPRARRASTWSAVTPLVWTAAERPGLRRRRAGDAAPGGRAPAGATSPSASSSSAPAACATSSSPCSCCSWCTAAATRRCAQRRHAAGAGRAARRRLRRPRRRASAWPTPTGSCGGRAPAAAAPAAAHPPGARRRPAELRRLARAMGFRADAPRRRARGFERASGPCTPARCAGCTRSCSTGRCSERWPGCRPTRCG